ncbi:ATP-binding protein [Actinoplanes sp. NBRC 101535]|uniref:sensor histidine kinase n=1 Tax=Actinoplanes sp. NBRC 101535 TaxID=3032196 RepID=UPI00249FC6B7|nr:ATP-binding protein [Actinoplanes sp. NBRC 101535]GLY02754.1 hypothetical protein Acsp01_31330 [Actinoplanes sp. NBRC 101535]
MTPPLGATGTVVDHRTLIAPARLAAVAGARDSLPTMPVSPDTIARMAARLLGAPMAVWSLVDGDAEEPLGTYGVPERWFGPGPLPLTRLVGATVVSANRPLIVADAAGTLPGHPLIRDHGIRALLAVPVRDRTGTPLGSLTVLGTRPHPWTDADLRMLTELESLRQSAERPDHSAEAALHRVEQFRACHRRVDAAMRAGVATTRAVPEMLAAVGATLGWPAAELFLVDEAAGELWSAGSWSAATPAPDGLFDHRPVRGRGATGRAWEDGVPVWIPRLTEIIARGTAYERDRARICLGHGISTVVAVPVRDSHDVVGVLTCYAGAAENDEDLLVVLLEGVAAQIGAFVTLRRAESLSRELARVQNDFVSLVSHEIRTPLAAITAHVGILAEDSADFDPDSRVLIEAMARNVGELHTIVGTLLDLAGLESGHLPLAAQPVDLTTLVTTAAGQAGSSTAGQDAVVSGGGGASGEPARLFVAVSGVVSGTGVVSGAVAGMVSDSASGAVSGVASGAVSGVASGAVSGVESGAVSGAVSGAGETGRLAVATPDTRAGRLVVAAGPDMVVVGDERRLRQVIDQLLANAIRYNRPGGSVRLTLTGDRDAVELQVSDEGIGIPAAERDRVFDRFFRGGAVRHQGVEGSGLGLSIVRTIVRLHNGTITFHDNQPAGTRVVVRIPRGPASQ